MSKPSLPPLSLYIHLPWCVAKCPYCDFNSHKAGSAPPRGRYLQALAIDLANEAGKVGSRCVETIFMGGGTPSLFSGDEIGQILAAVQAEFDVCADAEITMEVNPGTVECGSLAAYRAAGVNRLSVGAQSFDADSLRKLGRIHGPAEIEVAIKEARAADFASINIDLMYALPGQTLAMARSDLQQALALEPEHLSCYQLTLEPNTVFYSRPPADLPGNDAAFEIQELLHVDLAAAGYQQYEISAFAKPGHQCRHNLNYWLFGDYAAVGAGAHGKITYPDGTIQRCRKPAHPLAYIEAAGNAAFGAGEPPLSQEDLVFEFMLNALRLPQGFTIRAFEDRTGLAYEAVRERLECCRADGLLQQKTDDSWQPTEFGLRFLNDLQANFLPPSEAV
jgi:oxygen-independent coproporphyrinogen-3 oxidase